MEKRKRHPTIPHETRALRVLLEIAEKDEAGDAQRYQAAAKAVEILKRRKPPKPQPNRKLKKELNENLSL